MLSRGPGLLDRVVDTGEFLLMPHNALRDTTAIMVVANYEDSLTTILVFAKLGEMILSEMNSLEVELLQQLRFSLVVPTNCTMSTFINYAAIARGHGV